MSHAQTDRIIVETSRCLPGGCPPRVTTLVTSPSRRSTPMDLAHDASGQPDGKRVRHCSILGVFSTRHSGRPLSKAACQSISHRTAGLPGAISMIWPGRSSGTRFQTRFGEDRWSTSALALRHNPPPSRRRPRDEGPSPPEVVAPSRSKECGELHMLVTHLSNNDLMLETSNVPRVS
jgi:hypothetical protein